MGRIIEERLTFDDVLLLPAYSQVLPSEADISSSFCKGISLKLPVASAAMDTVTESEMAIAVASQGGIGVIHKTMPVEAQVAEVAKAKGTIVPSNGVATRDSSGRLAVAAVVSPFDDARAEALVAVGVDSLVIDSAHANSVNVIAAVSRFAGKFSVPIVAGNVCTADGAQRLIDAGAAGVKVGLGGGSICTTRIISGCGSPQLSAVLDCADVCREAGVPLIADGGIKYSGDAAKALAAGASCVMLGNFLAGTTESPGKAVVINGKKFKTYRGMGSLGAMAAGGRERYFQANVDSSKFVPEGIEGVVPFKGSAEDVLYQLAGGIRSAMGYCGAKTLQALWKAKFVRITNAGNAESHPHDVTITEEAPNYRKN